MEDKRNTNQDENILKEIKKEIKTLKVFSIVTSLSTVLIAIIWLIYFFIIQY